MSIFDSLRKLMFSDDSDSQIQQTLINNAKTMKTDLVEAEYFRGCCGECAKYRGRWFSISGRDKRFPKMPVDYGCTCSGLTFYPVIYGASKPDHCPKNKDIIEYSNRPFIDDRLKSVKNRFRIYGLLLS